MNLPRIREMVRQYDASLPLERASTIPASWYLDPDICELERTAVFGATWQMVGRTDQVARSGQFITAIVAGEPVLVVRGGDGILRAFFNVCRHHAAAVAAQEQGTCPVLRCPYHGWTYTLEGALKGAPEFDGVAGFDRGDHGLRPVAVGTWEKFVFVRLSDRGSQLDDWLAEVRPGVASLGLGSLQFVERRRYVVECNWKVYVDNYLDGGYHVPHIHKALNTVLEYKDYAIGLGRRHCLQSSPLRVGPDAATAAVRRGERACYYWVYPNFMLNWYEGVMDTNVVLPCGPGRCEVIFSFYFDDVSPAAGERNRRSIAVAEQVQREDIEICESVQRGLASRAYHSGRLSVRREAGAHLFHRLLHGDLTAALGAAGADGA